MRAANTYRGSRKREAKARGLVWRFLDKLGLSNSRSEKGTVEVNYPFEKNGKVIP